MKRAALLLPTLLSGLLVLPGCGDNGNGGKFCDLLEESLSGADLTTPEGAAAGAERFRDLVDEAPREIRNDVRAVQDAVAHMAAARTPEQIAAARDRIARSDTQTAILNLANYRATYC